MGEYIKKSDVEQIYNGLKEVAEGQMQGADTISMITLNGLVGGINMLMEGVKSLAPADVAPVVHGKWVYTEGWGVLVTNRCSRCGQTLTTKQEEKMNYCPSCGALMDGRTTPAYRMAQRLKARYSK